MDEILIQFKEVVDEEIQAYEEMSELYTAKQSILIQGKSDALWDIDAKILSVAENLKGLNQKRKSVAKYLGNEDLTMTEAIEKAKESNDSLAGSLMEQKSKISVIANAIKLQEKTNMTLIQHGLVMVGKTLDIIVGAFAPQATGQYDKYGQNISARESLKSSVEEEA